MCPSFLQVKGGTQHLLTFGSTFMRMSLSDSGWISLNLGSEALFCYNHNLILEPESHENSFESSKLKCSTTKKRSFSD